MARLEAGRLGAVEPAKGRVDRLVHLTAAEARTLLVLDHFLHLDLAVRQGRRQSPALDPLGRDHRPVALPAGDAAGEDAGVGRVAHGGERMPTQVVERGRGLEGGQHQPGRLLDHAQRRDVGAAVRVQRGDDALADERHQARFLRLTSSVLPAVTKWALSSFGRSTVTPQPSSLS